MASLVAEVAGRAPVGKSMFQRYTEKARRVIFFARYEAGQYGSPYIETEHLLLGLLREDRPLTKRFLGETDFESEIRAEIESHIPPRERISTSVEIPLTEESRKILNLATKEADRLGHTHIGTEHLLLGILHLESSLAGRILQARGLRLSGVREQMPKGSVPSSVKTERVESATLSLESFLSGLRWHKAEELASFFAQSVVLVDVHGKRWNREEIEKQFETLFAPYAKKNAAYSIEETPVSTGDLLVAIVLWKNAILASMERIWIHRMSVVLVRENGEWKIVLMQVTPVQPA
jgi:uncharacterized protein (TIGR02246 family)